MEIIVLNYVVLTITIWFNSRKIADRPRDPAKWIEIADVVAALSIPVIANGDVFEYDDIMRIKTATGIYSLILELVDILKFFNLLFKLCNCKV